MNRIGKGLVLLHAAVSLLALAWAAGLFLKFTDWGWKEPRTELGMRIPSEYDKRVAALQEAVKARDVALYGLKTAQASLREAEARFPQNHLFYQQELARLRSATDPIEVKSVKRAGPIVLDTPGKAIGRPVLEEKVEGIEKSYDSYMADLKKINEACDTEVKETSGWIEKEKAVTFLLNGKDDAKKDVKTTKGIYALLEVEKAAQDQAKFEKDYLQPVWARALEEAELYGSLHARLKKTLEGLRQRKK
jgi:hypothetical protein